MAGIVAGTPPTENKAPRGTLVIVASLLFASGVIRLGDGAGRAWAEVASQAQPVVAGTVAPPEDPAEEPNALLSALKDREAKLLDREAKVQERETSLAEARALAEKRISELAAQEAALSKTLTIADDAAEGDVARLVAVYETMKPKDAVPLFSVMDADFAAGFLARMKPEPAAAILAGLDPKIAYTISAVLAGRNARAPQN